MVEQQAQRLQMWRSHLTVHCVTIRSPHTTTGDTRQHSGRTLHQQLTPRQQMQTTVPLHAVHSYKYAVLVPRGLPLHELLLFARKGQAAHYPNDDGVANRWLCCGCGCQLVIIK